MSIGVQTGPTLEPHRRAKGTTRGWRWSLRDNQDEKRLSGLGRRSGVHLLLVGDTHRPGQTALGESLPDRAGQAIAGVGQDDIAIFKKASLPV